jgi:hypothetical protein
VADTLARAISEMGCFYRHEPVPANGLTVLFEPDEPSIEYVKDHLAPVYLLRPILSVS